MKKILLSVIIVTKNAENFLEDCLKSINKQIFDKKLIEILIIDGGSKDNTENIAKKYNINFFNAGFPDNQEARRYIGAKKASGEILLFFDADNRVKSKLWLKKMMEPFSDKGVIASFSKWYETDKNIGILGNYYALLGGNDPVAFYLGKHDRVPITSKALPWGSKLVYKKKNFDVVNFNYKKIPTLGCNGFFIRSKILKKLRIKSPQSFYHTDINSDILAINPNALYAIVYTGTIHDTGRNLFSSIKKRLKYKKIHNDNLSKYRRYKVFDPKSSRDILLLILLIIFGVTFIVPIFRALFGAFKTRRFEWLIHPFVNFFMIITYSYDVMITRLKFQKN